MDPDALSNIHKDYKTDLGFLLSKYLSRLWVNDHTKVVPDRPFVR